MGALRFDKTSEGSQMMPPLSKVGTVTSFLRGSFNKHSNQDPVVSYQQLDSGNVGAMAKSGNARGPAP